jgi:quercetin dioxygenase-like cupin family protein
VPRLLVEPGVEYAAGVAADRGGVVWRLAEPGRQLESDLVRLGPGAEAGEHAENELDVLLVVLEGSGRLDGPQASLELEPRAVVWLPRRSRGSVTAGPDGLAYLTTRQRRSGLGISSHGAAVAEGGEGPCLLDRVCPECGRLATEASARYCSRCGEALPERDAHSNE